MFNKFKAFLSKLFGAAAPIAQAILTQAVAAVISEVGTVALNVLMAKAGTLTENANIAYVGKNGTIKFNAVRDELARFAAQQGINVTQSTLTYIIENAHKAQPVA